MSKSGQSLSIALALGLGAAVLPATSHATTMPATGGHSAFFAESACWSQWGGTISNTNCNLARWWELPIIATGNGPVYVAVSANPGTNVECFEFIEGWDGREYSRSALRSPQFHGVAQMLDFHEQIPGLAAALVYCLVDQGNKVHTVNW